MSFMYTPCIPMQIKPNKSPLRKRLLALLLSEICHLSSPSRSCLGRLTLIRGRQGFSVGGALPHLVSAARPCPVPSVLPRSHVSTWVQVHCQLTYEARWPAFPHCFWTHFKMFYPFTFCLYYVYLGKGLSPPTPLKLLEHRGCILPSEGYCED